MPHDSSLSLPAMGLGWFASLYPSRFHPTAFPIAPSACLLRPCPPPLQAPLLSPRGFSHGFHVLQITLPSDVFSWLSSPHLKALPSYSPQGLIPFFPPRQRPFPTLACPPPAPSPVAASPSARWAPGTGRSPPSWCRRASGPRAGRGQGRQQYRAGRRPQEPVGWCRLGLPGRVGRAGGGAERRVGAGREVRWRAKARVAPWARLALPRL